MSASTCLTGLGMRRLSGPRTQPTHRHVHLEAGVAPKPQAGPTSLLGERAQILLDPTQCLADDTPRIPPGSPRKRPLWREPSLGGAPSLVTARPSGLSQEAVARPLDFGFSKRRPCDWQWEGGPWQRSNSGTRRQSHRGGAGLVAKGKGLNPAPPDRASLPDH